MNLFCCTKYYMTDDMYNCLAYLMAGMKSTVARMKNPSGQSFNRGKYTLILDS